MFAWTFSTSTTDQPRIVAGKQLVIIARCSTIFGHQNHYRRVWSVSWYMPCFCLFYLHKVAGLCNPSCDFSTEFFTWNHVNKILEMACEAAFKISTWPSKLYSLFVKHRLIKLNRFTCRKSDRTQLVMIYCFMQIAEWTLRLLFWSLHFVEQEICC